MSLVEQLEQMRMRVNELAKQESNTVAALGDAFRETDDQLLHEVRRLTAEHEARRATILHELQLLASRLNEFPVSGRREPLLNNTTPGFLPGDARVDGQRLLDSSNSKHRSADFLDALNRVNPRSNH